jgi:hypothetical protein
MKLTVILPAILLAALIFVAGCSIIGGGQVTPTPTTAAPTPTETREITTTAVPATNAGASTKPGPTQTIPANEAVTVSVEKAGTYSTTIIATFNGGKGINFVSRIEVRVTRPDGSTETKLLQPIMSKDVEIEGTNGTDRVEVTAFMKSGNVYKIIDQQVPYKTRS